MPPKTRYYRKGTQHKQLESTHWTHVVRGHLAVVAPGPEAEVLIPRVARAELRRTPIVVRSKTTVR